MTLWKFRSPVEKFQHNVGEKKKNLRLDALKRVRRTILLYLHYPSHKAAQLSAKRDLLDL